jgi:cell division protein FtsL
MGGLLLALALVGALMAIGIYRVWSEYEVFEMGASLRAESELHSTLVDEQRKLKLELAAIEHAMEIERRAQEELGMRPPTDRDYVVVREE